MVLQYRNIRDLNACIADNLHRVPKDIDLIVGIPRSGMLPATLLSLYLDLPMTDLQGLLEGRIMQGGDRARFIPAGEVRKALVVDDSIFTGSQFRQVRATISQAALACEVVYCCPYIRADREADVDLFFEVIPGEKWLFEWNKFNHGIVPSLCCDLDGVFCRDPLPEEDDDGEAYRRFLETAEPKFRPRRRVGWIVTSRLEKYRASTEAWLARHGIEYGELHMMNLPSLAERTAWKSIQHKARVYSETPSSLFVESSLGHAQEICRVSGRPVLCTQNAEMIYPSSARAMAGRLQRIRNRFLRQLLSRRPLFVLGCGLSSFVA